MISDIKSNDLRQNSLLVSNQRCQISVAQHERGAKSIRWDQKHQMGRRESQTASE